VNETADNLVKRAPDGHDDLQRRILRSMICSVLLAVIVSTFVAPWPVTTGLLLGGALSLLNYRWLHGSIAAVLIIQNPGQRPQMKSSRYVLRYLLVGGVVFLTYNLGLISLPAALAGLCSFVVALFVEASREFYFAIIRREEPL
jgi:hypothetical protein